MTAAVRQRGMQAQAPAAAPAPPPPDGELPEIVLSSSKQTDACKNSQLNRESIKAASQHSINEQEVTSCACLLCGENLQVLACLVLMPAI